MISKSHRIDSRKNLIILQKRSKSVLKIVTIILIQGSTVHKIICHRMEIIIIEIIITTQTVRVIIVLHTFNILNLTANLNSVVEFRILIRYVKYFVIRKKKLLSVPPKINLSLSIEILDKILEFHFLDSSITFVSLTLRRKHIKMCHNFSEYAILFTEIHL